MPRAEAAIINVPADYSTITDAVNAAVNGDVIRVAPGTYVEPNLLILGKDITIESTDGPAVTVIDGDAAPTGVGYGNNAGRNSILRGFTVTNALSLIEIFDSSPTIENNILTGNLWCGRAALFVYNSAPVVRNNDIHDNIASGCESSGAGVEVFFGEGIEIVDNVIHDNHMLTGTGAGLALYDTTGVVEGNFFYGNTTTYPTWSPGGLGGAILAGIGDVLITNNLFYENTADYGGAISVWMDDPLAAGPTIINNTMYDNEASLGGSAIRVDGYTDMVRIENNIIVEPDTTSVVYCGDEISPTSLPILRYNDVYSPLGSGYDGLCPDVTGTDGNIAQDPLFVDTVSYDFHLGSGSPAIDSGDNLAPSLPANDIDDDPRVQDGDGDEVAVVDMGAYEMPPPPPPPLPTPSDAFCAGATATTISSSDQLFVLQQAVLDGDARSAGGIKVDASATVTGSQTPFDSSAAYAALTVPPEAVNLGTLKLSGSDTLTLGSGVFVADQLELKNLAEVFVTATPSDPCILYLAPAGRVLMDHTSRLNAAGNAASLIIIPTGNKESKFIKDTVARLALFGPLGAATMADRAQVTGALVGKKVTIKGDTVLTQQAVGCP